MSPRASPSARKHAVHPSWSAERALWEEGCSLVAGVDEVGRGPLAGPVVAAAVVLPRSPDCAPWIGELRDSKVLPERARERLAERIRAEATWAVASVSQHIVDQVNIRRATLLAMRRAVDNLPARPDGLIIDGTEIVEGDIRQVAIVGGDGLSVSVAAASILAKVTRDRMMCDLDRLFPGYGLAINKGYATRDHRDALARLGYTCIHRLSFAPVRDAVRTRTVGS
jgi:ribonuclease HII